MFALLCLVLFNVMTGVSSMPLKRNDGINIDQDTASSYITSQKFNVPTLEDGKVILLNETTEKYPQIAQQNSYDDKFESKSASPIDNLSAPPVPIGGTISETLVEPTLIIDTVTNNTNLDSISESESSEDVSKDRLKSKPIFKYAGTMPRFGRAFGPLRPPRPQVESNSESELDISSEKSEAEAGEQQIRRELSKSSPKQNISLDVLKQLENTQRNLPDGPQIGSISLTEEFRQYPPPPNPYGRGLDFYPPPGVGLRLPSVPQQPIFPPQIPYYNEVRLNDSVTRVDYLLSYDVNSEVPESERFGSQEKTQDGFIQGEFGFHGTNGVIRGVRYTADPNVHPQLLYETLIKFLAL